MPWRVAAKRGGKYVLDWWQVESVVRGVGTPLRNVVAVSAYNLALILQVFDVQVVTYVRWDGKILHKCSIFGCRGEGSARWRMPAFSRARTRASGIQDRLRVQHPLPSHARTRASEMTSNFMQMEAALPSHARTRASGIRCM